MQFALVIHENIREWSVLPEAERHRIGDACRAWHTDLAARGKGLAAVRLMPPSSATIVRGPRPDPILTDGPFAEAREVLGGVELIDCRDREEAIAIARTFPGLDTGFVVEVRRVLADNERCQPDPA